MTVRFNKSQKLMMLAIPLAITTNPLTVEIFIDWYKWLLAGVSWIASAYILGFMLYNMFKPQPNNIPSKSKKHSVKSKEYIDS